MSVSRSPLPLSQLPSTLGCPGGEVGSKPPAAPLCHSSPGRFPSLVPASEIEIVAVFPTASKNCVLPRFEGSASRAGDQDRRRLPHRRQKLPATASHVLRLPMRLLQGV
ncbi:uncharacterized protein [Aegilops tauschii subsp. strangulata]|uniref:uncharacterized protein isoform X7 n=1 Tax=Aegilops tauschii subsp. strangulata TaxID=200361 RepID=UPI001E1C9E23|nr:uncharacterized protein LOC109782493 isoform X11 [Aegilops tauschii subsp. strangulata]